MATYYVTGVWKNSSKVITHLLVHLVSNNNNLDKGVKTSESDVITSLSKNNQFFTIRWNYQSASWVQGTKIEVVVERGTGRAYLRTVADAQVVDNLDNIISMVAIV